jgi:hypothetical protein
MFLLPSRPISAIGLALAARSGIAQIKTATLDAMISACSATELYGSSLYNHAEDCRSRDQQHFVPHSLSRKVDASLTGGSALATYPRVVIA